MVIRVTNNRVDCVAPQVALEESDGTCLTFATFLPLRGRHVQRPCLTDLQCPRSQWSWSFFDSLSTPFAFERRALKQLWSKCRFYIRAKKIFCYLPLHCSYVMMLSLQSSFSLDDFVFFKGGSLTRKQSSFEPFANLVYDWGVKVLREP